MRARRILYALIFCAAFLGTAGCFSKFVNRNAGGDMVWYCDKCKQQVGSMDTHVCGLTVFDEKTGKDIPMEDVTQAEINDALADEQAGGRPSVTHKDIMEEQDSRSWWQFWKRRSGARVEPTSEPEPEAAPAPAPTDEVPAETEQPKKKSRWKFWQKK